MAVCPGCRGRLWAVYGRARKESNPNRGLVRFFFEPSCLLAVASRLPSWDLTWQRRLPVGRHLHRRALGL